MKSTERKNKIKVTKSRIAFVVANYILLGSLALCCLLPFINLGAISFSSPKYAESGSVNLIPKGFTVSAYKFIFSNGDFLRALWNSIKLLLIGVPWIMVMTFLCAYPLSRPKHKFIGRKIYIVIIWVCMLFSGGTVAEYMLKCALKLNNTIWALILPGVPVFNVILLMNFFRQIPEDFHEAAEMDGANDLYIMIKIYIPLAKPAVLTTMLFTIVELWNQWLPGVMYYSTIDKMPLQSYLQSVTVDLMDEKLSSMLSGNLVSENTIESARLFLSIIPMLLLYLPLQKHFIKGLTAGGVKG